MKTPREGTLDVLPGGAWLWGAALSLGLALVCVSKPVDGLLLSVAIGLGALALARPMWGAYVLAAMIPISASYFIIRGWWYGTVRSSGVAVEIVEKLASTVMFTERMFLPHVFAIILMVVLLLRTVQKRSGLEREVSSRCGEHERWSLFFLGLMALWMVTQLACWVPQPERAVWSALRLWANVPIVWFLVRVVNTRRRLHSMLVAQCGVAALLCPFAILGTNWGFVEDYVVGAFRGMTVFLEICLGNGVNGFNPDREGLLFSCGLAYKHEFSMCLASASLFSVVLIILSKSRVVRGLLGIAVMVFMTFLYGPPSKTTLFGMMLVLAAVGVLFKPARAYCIPIMLAFILINVVAFNAAGLLLQPQFDKDTKEMSTKFTAVGAKSEYQESGMGLRKRIWRTCLARCKKYNWCGEGGDCIGRDPVMVVPHAHNLFIQLLVDFGIPGLVLIASVLVLVIGRLSLVIVRGLGGMEQTWINLGLLAAIAQALFEYMFDLFAWSPHLWFLIGLACAAIRISERSR